MKKYLNLTGLDHLVSKLKGYFIKNPASGSEGQYLRLGSNNEITWSSLPQMLTYKGDVPTVANLPQIDNEIGDVWYVTTTSEEYFWKEDNGTYSWELLGLPTYGPATTSQVGVVKPDGTTITVDSDGTIHSAGGGTTYTAGDHITIASNVISAKTSYIDNAEYELDTFYATNTTKGDCRFVFYTSELENYITITDPDTLQSETCLYIGHLLKMELYNLLDLKWEDLPDPYGIVYRTFYLTTLSNTSKIYIVADTEVESLFDADNILTSYVRTGTASGELCLASDIKALLGIKENLIHAVSPIHLERSVADGTLLGLDYDTNTLIEVNNKLSVSTSLLANWNSTSGRSEILNKPTLATVATSGSYNDLIDKPTIPTVPTQVSAFTNDAGYVTSIPNAFSKVKVGTTIIEAPSTAATVEMIAGLNVTITPSTASGSITIEASGGGGSGTTYSFAEGSVNGAFEVTPIGGTTSNIPVHGVLTAHLTLTSHAQVADTSTAGKVLVSTNNGYEWQNLPSTITSSTVSGWGFTTNVGTVTGVSFNGTDGTINNGKVALTATIPASLVQVDWNSASGLSSIANKPTLATVATSGSYNDLTDKPTIPASQVQVDWNASSGLASIANKPTIPASLIQSDWALGTTSAVDYIKNKPTTISGYGITDAYISGNSISLGGVSRTIGSAPLNIKVADGVSTSTVCSFSSNATSNSDFTIIKGSNVTLTPDTALNTVTIDATDTTYSSGNTTISVTSLNKIKANGYIRPHDDEVVLITDANVSYEESIYALEQSNTQKELIYCDSAVDWEGTQKTAEEMGLSATKRYNVVIDAASVGISLKYSDITMSKWEGVKTYHYVFIPKHGGSVTVTLYNGLSLLTSLSGTTLIKSIFINNSSDWVGSPAVYTGDTDETVEVIITFVAAPSDTTDPSTIDGYYTLVRLLHK